MQEERRREKEKERVRRRLNRKKDSRRHMRIDSEEQCRSDDVDATQSDSGSMVADVIDVTTPGTLATALLRSAVLCIAQFDDIIRNRLT